MVSGKCSLRENTSAQKRYLRLYGSLEIHIFWAGLMATKKDFYRFGVFKIKDGSEIRFWEDVWVGNATLRDQYPAL